MCRPPATTDRRPLTTTPAEADLTLATGSHDPPRPDTHHLLAEAATTIPKAAALEPKSRQRHRHHRRQETGQARRHGAHIAKLEAREGLTRLQPRPKPCLGGSEDSQSRRRKAIVEPHQI